MTNETAASESSIQNRNARRHVALALLGGVFTISVLVYLLTIRQIPDVSPPIRMAPIFVFVAVFASIAGPLVWWDHTVGYATAVLAGAFAILGIALYLTGVFGPARPSPGSLAYAALGALLVIASVVAARGPASANPRSDSTPTSR